MGLHTSITRRQTQASAAVEAAVGRAIYSENESGGLMRAERPGQQHAPNALGAAMRGAILS
jgi:hypothetical protein